MICGCIRLGEDMNKILGRLEENYIVVFKVYIVAQVLLQWLLAPVVPWLGKIGNIFIVLMAMLIYFYNYKKKTILFYKGMSKTACVFLFAVLVSIIFNFRYNLIDNVETYLVLLIEILILMPVYSENKKKILADMRVFFNGFAIIMFICSTIGFILYITDNPIYLYSTRFCGVFSNPNQSSIMSFFAIISSLIIIVIINSKKDSVKHYKLEYSFQIINILLNLCMFTLSNSNTGRVMFMVLFGMIGFFACFYHLNSFHVISRSILGCILGFLCVLLSHGTYNLVQGSLAYVPGVIVVFQNEKLFGNFLEKEELENEGIEHTVGKEEPSSNKIDNITIPKKEFDRSKPEGGINNNRFEIWAEGMQAFSNSMFIGFGPRNVYGAVVRYVDSPRTEIEAGGLHNMYIELLVSCGLFGFVSFILMVIVRAVPVIKRLFVFDKNFVFERRLFLLLSVSVIAFLVMNMAESTLLFTTSAYSILFWCILGYLLNFESVMNLEKES